MAKIRIQSMERRGCCCSCCCRISPAVGWRQTRLSIRDPV